MIAPQFTGRRAALSLGLIIVSFVYALWQHSGGSQPVAATIPAAPGQASSSAVTPAQSYKAANDALLQTLSQLASTGSTPPPPNQPAAAPQKSGATKTQPVISTPQPTLAPIPQKPAGMYADGSYTGSPADAYYGTVQVRAIIKGGLLADVQFLQYPSDRSTSRYINSQAMPLLTQEAIKAQSAQVDGVSGATFTSQAFQQSLASALTPAKN